jgi:hypothetical protein
LTSQKLEQYCHTVTSWHDTLDHGSQPCERPLCHQHGFPRLEMFRYDMHLVVADTGTKISDDLILQDGPLITEMHHTLHTATVVESPKVKRQIKSGE